MSYESLKVKRAEGSYIYDISDNKYLDLSMGYGSAALGHNYSAVANGLREQLGIYSTPGFLNFDVQDKAKKKVAEFISHDYILHGFHPTGALAIEFVLKMAIVNKRKTGIISFERSMHGRTIAASQLGFDSSFATLPNLKRLPLPDTFEEEYLLAKFNDLVKTNRICAVIIEPIQMTAGGKMASISFYNEMAFIAKQHDVLVVFDEILTGCYRSGSKFYFNQLSFLPDVVVIGKALGNGYPVTAVACKSNINITNEMKPGGTYFNHPLACTAALLTIEALSNIQAETLIRNIHNIITSKFSGFNIKGVGAMWCIEIGEPSAMKKLISALLNDGIIVSYYDNYIRLLPSYMIDNHVLHEACDKIVKNLIEL